LVKKLSALNRSSAVFPIKIVLENIFRESSFFCNSILSIEEMLCEKQGLINIVVKHKIIAFLIPQN
jgi:hypothetical protein